MDEIILRVLVGLGGPYIEITGRGPATRNRYSFLWRGQRTGGLERSASVEDILQDLATEIFNIAPLVDTPGGWRE